MSIWACRAHVPMTSMTSSVERTDLDFKISVALLLLEEQSDQGLHCLPFPLNLLDPLLCSKTILFKFKADYSIFSGVQILRTFTVYENKT